MEQFWSSYGEDVELGSSCEIVVDQLSSSDGAVVEQLWNSYEAVVELWSSFGAVMEQLWSWGAVVV